ICAEMVTITPRTLYHPPLKAWLACSSTRWSIKPCKAKWGVSCMPCPSTLQANNQRQTESTMENIIFEQIKKDITSNDVVLYMKGTAVFPQCGFSAAVVQILSQLGVAFKDVNVLEDENIRQGIKDFASWPTIPQLYIKGEFVGG